MDISIILGIIGLSIIIIAWIVQLITILCKSKNLSLFFVWLHLIGILIIVIANIGFKSFTTLILNILLIVFTIITIIFYPRKNKEKNV
ncbi:MAG: hypothetical protein KAW92_10760 [Candidatus Cloacimonetes bacterium]|nr:hypothetical protein [Candidatus Cloacimonadota bacterium]